MIEGGRTDGRDVLFEGEIIVKDYTEVSTRCEVGEREVPWKEIVDEGWNLERC